MSTTPIEISFEATPELGKLAARRFILKQQGLGLIILLMIAAGCTVAAVMGHQQWYVIVGLTISYGCMLQTFGYYRRADVYFRDRVDTRVTIRLTDEHFESEGKGRFNRIAWDQIESVLKCDGVWLFSTSQGGPFVPVPTEYLSAEARELIEDSIIRSGGSIE